MTDLKIVKLEQQEYPVLPLRDVVVFPHMVIPLFVGREKSIEALHHATENGNQVLLVAQKDANNDDPGKKDIYSHGCIALSLFPVNFRIGRISQI